MLFSVLVDGLVVNNFQMPNENTRTYEFFATNLAMFLDFQMSIDVMGLQVLIMSECSITKITTYRFFSA